MMEVWALVKKILGHYATICHYGEAKNVNLGSGVSLSFKRQFEAASHTWRRGQAFPSKHFRKGCTDVFLLTGKIGSS